jgi:DNA topoisomerase-1
MLSQAQQAEEPLGYDPESSKPVYLKVGRFGPYVQRGSTDDEEKPQNASLLKGMTPDVIDLPMALKLLSLPRELGANPQDGKAVVAHNGRFGPYIKCGDETRSLPAEVSPIDVTLDQALHLLSQPKAQRRGFGAKREPIQVFEPTPANPAKIELLDGRYGLYVTDGTTNASLPKNMTPEELTVELAQRLLAERAAAGPPKKKAPRRGSPRKPAAAKATVPKAPKAPKAKSVTAAKKSAKKKPGR